MPHVITCDVRGPAAQKKMGATIPCRDETMVGIDALTGERADELNHGWTHGAAPADGL